MGRKTNAAANPASASESLDASRAAEAKAAEIEAAKVALDAANAEVKARADELAEAKAKTFAAGDTEAEKVIAAAITAAEDALAEAKTAAVDAQLKLEALTEPAAVQAEEADPILFDVSETGLDLPGLIALLKNGAVLIFGANGQSLPSVPVQPTRMADWSVTGGRLEFAGSFTFVMPIEGVPTMANAVALADGLDGPVRSVSALGGDLLLAPGGEYKFAAGALVFEGVMA